MEPNVFYRWQRELFEHGAAAFERNNGRKEKRYERTIGRLEDNPAHKDRVIPEIMEEHVQLKKIPGNKEECIRKRTPLSLEDARRVVSCFVECYNTQRLHSAIGYITPADKPAGRAEVIFKERDRKLHEARQRRRHKRHNGSESLTLESGEAILTIPGKTDAGSAGEHPAGDSRVRFRHTSAVGVKDTTPTAEHGCVDSSHASENPEPPKADHCLILKSEMSDFR